MGWWWQSFSGIWILSLHQLKKKQTKKKKHIIVGSPLTYFLDPHIYFGCLVFARKSKWLSPGLRKYHNHTLQTNPGHREEESQHTSSHKTSGRQLKWRNQLSLPQQDDCKTRKDTKTKTKHNPNEQWEQQYTKNEQQQNHNLKRDSSRIKPLVGLNAFYLHQIFAPHSDVVKTQK